MLLWQCCLCQDAIDDMSLVQSKVQKKEIVEHRQSMPTKSEQHISGHPEPNQGPADHCCIHLQSAALTI